MNFLYYLYHFGSKTAGGLYWVMKNSIGLVSSNILKNSFGSLKAWKLTPLNRSIIFWYLKYNVRYSFILFCFRQKMSEVLSFENKAWEFAKKPHFISEEFKHGGETLCFEVGWHHGRRGWYVETCVKESERYTLKTIKIFESMQEVITHFEKTYKITPDIPINKARRDE